MTFWKWAICIKKKKNPLRPSKNWKWRSRAFSKLQTMLCFHCHAIKNRIANHSIQKVQNLENERRWVYKKLRQESGLCDISYARYSEKSFTQICKALSKDAILVFPWGTQIWPPETNKNISLFLQMLEINTWRTHKDLLFNVYSEKRDVYWIF